MGYEYDYYGEYSNSGRAAGVVVGAADTYVWVGDSEHDYDDYEEAQGHSRGA